MAFYSLAFFSFVIFFLIIHNLIGEIFPKYQWVVRLIAGVTFFIYLSRIRIIYIIASALTIWCGGLVLDRMEQNGRKLRKSEDLSKEEKKALKQKTRNRKLFVMFLLVAVNLGILIFAKYLLPATDHPIALPIGISFYTLMAVSYLVDVYGEKYEPQKNFAKMLLYLCWFPQLIQGPINRYNTVRDSLYATFRLHADDFRYAFYMFLFGAIKKYAIADLLAPMVNESLNNNSGTYPGSYLLFGAILFAIEQYANFSGGIDMTVGISLMFGVKLDENFRQPYFATSLGEFWRRWHISLGSFMRDYVFYPFVTTKPVSKMNKYIGKRFGNHAARALTGGISNLLVFALVGLWHGREHHYLMWGLYNGIIIALGDAFAPMFAKLNAVLHIKDDSKGLYCFRVFRTFMIIVFAGYFDVIGPVRTGLSCFINTFTLFNASSGGAMIAKLFTDDITSVQAVVTALIAIILLIINSVVKEKGGSVLGGMIKKPFYVRWIVFFLLLLLLMYSFTVSSGIRGFMYAAF